MKYGSLRLMGCTFLLVLSMITSQAQVSYSVVAEATDDVVKVNWESQMEDVMYEKLSAEDKAGLMKMYTDNIRVAHYRAMEFIHNAKHHLSKVLEQHNNGNKDPKYDGVRQMLEKTVLLRENDYTLYLPEVIKACDDILAGVTHNYNICSDTKDMVCKGNRGFTHAHVFMQEEIDANADLGNTVVICSPWGLDYFYQLSMDKPRWDCLISTLIHELHHLRTGSRHDVDHGSSVPGTSSAPLGAGKFMKDSFRFEALVMGLNLQWDEFNKWCGECSDDKKELICEGKVKMSNSDTPHSPWEKPVQEQPKEEQPAEHQPQEEAKPAEEEAQPDGGYPQ